MRRSRLLVSLHGLLAAALAVVSVPVGGQGAEVSYALVVGEVGRARFLKDTSRLVEDNMFRSSLYRVKLRSLKVVEGDYQVRGPLTADLGALNGFSRGSRLALVLELRDGALAKVVHYEWVVDIVCLPGQLPERFGFGSRFSEYEQNFSGGAACRAVY
jgi:hypothetical protein